jgi:hypothetical protein
MPFRARAYFAYALGLAVSGAVFPNTALAEGTAADAKAMLDKTIAALKADKAKTLTEINAGTNGSLFVRHRARRARVGTPRFLSLLSGQSD